MVAVACFQVKERCNASLHCQEDIKTVCMFLMGFLPGTFYKFSACSLCITNGAEPCADCFHANGDGYSFAYEDTCDAYATTVAT
jgi:hypothetical protein